MLVACPRGGRLAEEAAAVGALVRDWSADRSPGPATAAEAWRLRRIVRAAVPDVVHLHSAKAGLAGRLAVRGAVPTVFQPHAWSFAAVDGPMAAATLRWERFATRWAHRLLCVSVQERADGVAAGVHADWAVVPNGVDVRHYAPADRRAARIALGLDLDAPLAVCVGRLCRQKGQDVLLAAWPEVLRRVPRARLALVGGGPEQQRMAETVRESAEPCRVRLVGDVPDPRPWLAAADLVVLPSRWEGMALAPLEAMAAARPVLLTDVPGAGSACRRRSGRCRWCRPRGWGPSPPGWRKRCPIRSSASDAVPGSGTTWSPGTTSVPWSNRWTPCTAICWAPDRRPDGAGPVSQSGSDRFTCRESPPFRRRSIRTLNRIRARR